MSGRSEFRERVAAGMADQRVVQSIRLATLHKVDARAEALRQLRDPEAMRTLAGQIKQHTLDHLPDYLEQFVAAVERVGGRVHFAADGDAARRIVCGIATSAGAKLAVKSKSMTTEEIHLNAALEQIGVKTVETDLGEFIVQIDHDTPSHIVTPIIHKDRRQIARSMQRELGCEYTEDPEALTMIARRHLRDIFRRCDLGISGVNFGVAESGTLCICTNEGNGRMTVTRPRVHIALMGIEKLVPRLSDLPVFLKLLARSSTGQPLTVYTTLLTGPKRPHDLDGPAELHVVLLDNGRSNILCGSFREVLRCIRCGACLNACPVYRSVGGHAYGSVYPGPIGALVTPLLKGMHGHEDLPRASSLCGACYAACPVQIDIPKYLVMLRSGSRDSQPWVKRAGIRFWAWMMQSPARYRVGQWCMRRLGSRGPDGWVTAGRGPLGAWTQSRDLPPPARRSFRAAWEESSRDSTPSRATSLSNVGHAEARDERVDRLSDHPPRTKQASVRDFIAALRDRMRADAGGRAPLPDSSNIARQVQAAEPLLDKFTKAAAEMGCVVHSVDRTTCPARIAEILSTCNARSIMISNASSDQDETALLASVRAHLAQCGIAVTGESNDDVMFGVDCGITANLIAVAETGTIVCRSGKDEPRGASLIPPMHIAIVHVSRIVPDLCDAFEMLDGRTDLPANVNVITGPSKTADIEGVLVKGVHGPGAVHIVLVN